MNHQTIFLTAKTQSDAAYVALRDAIVSCRSTRALKSRSTTRRPNTSSAPARCARPCRVSPPSAWRWRRRRRASLWPPSRPKNSSTSRAPHRYRAALSALGCRPRRRRVEATIIAAFHRLHRLPTDVSREDKHLSPAWVAAHNAFHAALTSACESRWSLTIREMLYAQSERYRSLSKIVDNERDIDSEHKGLLDACLSRDADLACERIEAHLCRTMEILLASPRLSNKGAPA